MNPPPVRAKKPEHLDHLALVVCIRLASTQVRLWHLTADTLIYEAPPELEAVDLDIGFNFQRAADELTKSGHRLDPAYRAKTAGHQCQRCQEFHKKEKFNQWLIGGACLKQTTGIQRKKANQNDFVQRAVFQLNALEQFKVTDSESEEEQAPQPTSHQSISDTESFNIFHPDSDDDSNRDSSQQPLPNKQHQPQQPTDQVQTDADETNGLTKEKQKTTKHRSESNDFQTGYSQKLFNVFESELLDLEVRRGRLINSHKDTAIGTSSVGKKAKESPCENHAIKVPVLNAVGNTFENQTGKRPGESTDQFSPER